MRARTSAGLRRRRPPARAESAGWCIDNDLSAGILEASGSFLRLVYGGSLRFASGVGEVRAGAKKAGEDRGNDEGRREDRGRAGRGGRRAADAGRRQTQ